MHGIGVILLEINVINSIKRAKFYQIENESIKMKYKILKNITIICKVPSIYSKDVNRSINHLELKMLGIYHSQIHS